MRANAQFPQINEGITLNIQEFFRKSLADGTIDQFEFDIIKESSHNAMDWMEKRLAKINTSKKPPILKNALVKGVIPNNKILNMIKLMRGMHKKFNIKYGRDMSDSDLVAPLENLYIYAINESLYNDNIQNIFANPSSKEAVQFSKNVSRVNELDTKQYKQDIMNNNGENDYYYNTCMNMIEKISDIMERKD